MRRVVRSVVAVAAVLAMMSCAGCGSKKESQDADVPENVSEATVSVVIPHPEPYTASDILSVQCMRERGFNMPTNLSYTSSAATTSYADVGGVFTSLDQATATGYPQITVKTNSTNTINGYQASLSKSEQERFEQEYNGSIDDTDAQKEISTACSVQALRWVYGSWKNYANLADIGNEWSSKRSESTLQQKEVQDAIDTYTQCMAKAGYKVDGLRAYKIAGKEFGRYRSIGSKPNAKEQALATQDFRCQDEAGIIPAVRKAMNHVSGRWMVENEARILELNDVLQETMERANSVINGDKDYATVKAETNGTFRVTGK